MNNLPAKTSSNCLNCGTALTDRFCPHCGQKAQPTRLPLREVLGEASSTFLNLDGLFWRTLTTLFAHPGRATREFNDGKRAAYLPPLRVYLSISVIYFVTLQFIGRDQILFVNLTLDETEKSGAAAIGVALQYALFLLVPALAGALQLMRCRRAAYYVEYLVFAVHQHSVWFGLFWLQLVMSWMLGLLTDPTVGAASIANEAIKSITQILPVAYLVLSLRRVFDLSWWSALWKSFCAMLLYMALLAGATALIVYITIKPA